MERQEGQDDQSLGIVSIHVFHQIKQNIEIEDQSHRRRLIVQIFLHGSLGIDTKSLGDRWRLNCGKDT